MRWQAWRIGRLPGAAVLATALVVPLLGGMAYAFWPRANWHSGPTAADLEAEVAPQHIAALATPLADAMEAEGRPATIPHKLRVGKGDTLMAMLTGAGIDRREAHNVITALSEIYSPRSLKPGQEIRLMLASTTPPNTEGRLLSLRLRPRVEQDVRVSRANGRNFIAEAIDRPLVQKTTGARGTIQANLSVALGAARVPIPVMIELIRAFSFDVDFQREIQPGDGFEVVYDALYEESGELAKSGQIVYAALTLSGETHALYHFTPKSGHDDYFDPKGQSVRKTLMRTPIDGARLSSRYGKRKHPILGYTKMHRGIDFAAPRGTPIYAAGNGVVELAGRKGGYGKYLRIRHNGTYKTAYAHMSRIAKSMHPGKRVKQGQVIGYVGSTGRSTGPHLHYEVMRGGRQVNPLRIKLPSGEKLKGKDLKSFQAARAGIDTLRIAVLGETQIVRAGCTAVTATGATEDLSAAC
jgi:murein DD-endopeptidase MepM/ murein hydrolase activator NlpD